MVSTRFWPPAMDRRGEAGCLHGADHPNRLRGSCEFRVTLKSGLQAALVCEDDVLGARSHYTLRALQRFQCSTSDTSPS